MQKFISLTKIVAVNIFVLLLLLFFTNYACRFILRKSAVNRADLPNYQNDPELAKNIFADYAQVSHEYVPFLGWKTLPYQGKTLTIQNNGFRKVVEPVLSDTADRLSVGFFGGSTLWGEGSSDSLTIPSLFAQLNPQFKIYNFGQLAFNSRQNLATLVNLYSQGIKLDLVVFYDGVNDAAFLCPNQVSVPGHRMEPVFRERLYVGSTILIKKAFYKYFFQNTLLVINRLREKKFNQKQQSEYLCYQDEDKIVSIADGMFNNWKLANSLVTANGGSFVGVLQPMAYRGQPNLHFLKGLDPELGKSMNAVYDDLVGKLDTQEGSLNVLNLTDAFDGQELIYIDFCHVSSNGNQIITTRINEYLGEIYSSSIN